MNTGTCTHTKELKTDPFLCKAYLFPRDVSHSFRALDSLKAVLRQDYVLVIVDFIHLVYTFMSHLSLSLTSLFFFTLFLLSFPLSHLFSSVL